MSSPLAATSVAINILLRPFLNEAITRSLLLWRRSPWMASAEWPSSFNRFTILSALLLVLTKTRIDPFLDKNWSINSSYLFSLNTWSVDCLIFAIGTDVDPVEILSGFVKYLSEILKMFCGKVAENNNVWWSLGTNFNIISICGVKPMSNILSVSSNTKYLVAERFRLFLFKWSLILPGVPTIILDLLLNCLSCFCIASPPISNAVLILILSLIILLMAAITWDASSLVGHITKAKAFLSNINLLISGILKAKVFPVPVCAVPKISLPSKATGMAILWIGVGFVKFIFRNEFFNESSIFNNLKFSIWMLDFLKLKEMCS